MTLAHKHDHTYIVEHHINILPAEQRRLDLSKDVPPAGV